MTISMPQVESLTVMVGVGAGSRFETRRISGLSHFLEHMAFKGTQKRPTTKQIATEVEAVGGEFSAYTDKEFTGYYLKLAAKHQELAFDILSDMLSNSLLKQEEIEREKGVIFEEINLREDVPMTKAAVSFERLIYGDNPMGWDIAGEKETVKEINRSDFLAYLNRLYYPRNMVLVLAGKINQSKVIRLAHKYFSPLQKVGHKVTKPIRIKQTKPRLMLVTKKTEQAHFCLGVPGYELNHKDRFTLWVLTAVLGVGMSSRLFLEVRERRGLAYYINTDTYLFTDSGCLNTRAGVKLAKIEEAIRIIIAEMNRLMTTKVAAKELNKAKEIRKGGLILALEDSFQQAERYVTQLILEKKIRTPKQSLNLIDRVTADDVLRVAKDLFRPEKLNLAIVGPYKNEQPFKKLLK